MSQEIGASLVDDFPDGVWFVGLADLSDPNMLRPLVAETFNVGEDALDGFLGGKSILIIIDNCEHVVAGAASLVQSLLTSPGVKVIATTREALNLAGERVFQVPPLPVPVPESSQEIMTGCPSVDLFVERAQAVNSSFQLTLSNTVSVNQIVRRLDGIPLAIELAASRVKMLQPAQIAGHLDESFKILSGGPVDALPHHQTIERTIDWSYDLLDPEQQLLFRRLSVFRGGFTLSACGAAMGTEDEFEALDALGDLVDKSLVRAMPAEEEARYHLLEPLRQYAAEKITSEEAAVAGGRHARFYRDLAESAAPELHGPRQIELLAMLEIELDNFRVALTWSLENSDTDSAQRTAVALAWFWLYRRHAEEAADWFNRALAMDGGTLPGRAALLVQSGFVSSVVSIDGFEGCLEQIRDGLAIFTELGDQQGVVTAQTNEAVLLWYQRDLEGSSSRLTEIQKIHQTYGFEWGDAFCSFFLGSICRLSGDLMLAREHLIRSLDLFRRLGDPGLVAWNLLRLGNIDLAQNEMDQAMDLFEEGLAVMDEVGDRHGVGAVMLAMGMAAELRGETEEAELLLVGAQTNLREGGGGAGMSWPISNVLVDTRTYELLAEATNRYQSSLALPPGEWASMVYADRDVWFTRYTPNR